MNWIWLLVAALVLGSIAIWKADALNSAVTRWYGRRGTLAPTPTPGPAGTPATPVAPVFYKKPRNWGMAGLLVIALGLVLVGGLVPPSEWFKQAPAMAEVSTWSWDRWISLAILTGLIVAIIYLLAEAKVAGTLMWIPIGVIGFLLLGAPFFAWIQAPSTTSSAAVASRQIPLATKPLSQWPKLGINPGARSIILPVFGDMRPVIGEGSGYILYCEFLDGRSFAVSGNRCPREELIQAYAVNTRDDITITLSYAYEQ